MHFFDRNYQRGLAWYLQHFPPAGLFEGCQTGEASPSYVLHPEVPGRIRATLGRRVKLVLLLREPVARAYSHYHHNRRLGRVTESFEECVARELVRLKKATGPEADVPADSPAFGRFDYLYRSCYVEQLEHWRAYLDEGRLLVLTSEGLIAQPQRVLGTVASFLGLESAPLEGLPEVNRHPYPPLSERIRERLQTFFEPFNRRLFSLLGWPGEWPVPTGVESR